MRPDAPRGLRLIRIATNSCSSDHTKTIWRTSTMPRLKGLLSASAFAALAVVCSASPAEASCVGPNGRLVWTWPEDGAAAVNPNTGFAAYGFSGSERSAMREFVVTVNGVTLEAAAFDDRVLRIPLEPSTDYILEFAFADGTDGSVSFATGEATTLSDALPTPMLESMAWQEYFGRGPSFRRADCGPVLTDYDCYDTGPRWLIESRTSALSLDDYPAAAVLWETQEQRSPDSLSEPQPTLLPASNCDPTLTTTNIVTGPTAPDGNRMRPTCIRTRYHVPDGRTSEWSDYLCTPEPYPEPGEYPTAATGSGSDVGSDAGIGADASAEGEVTSEDTSGCAVIPTSPLAPAATLVPIAFALIASRRRRGNA
jgi:hypothetical protein